MAIDFVAGCLGGCAGIMVGYPLDTVKVHMQTQDYRNPKYRGTWHCFHTLLVKDSVAGLYRGISSPMAGVAAVNAVVFGVYGHAQRHLSNPESLSSHFLAGASAGIAQTPVCSPIELAKTRLQLQSACKPMFSGPMQCLKHIYKHEGYRGVFKGLNITFLREGPSYGVYFLTYEALTRTSSNTVVSTPWMLLAGGLAGTASWVISYPLDVIKSRIQAESSNRYSGAIDCLKQSVREEGYTCLYRGLNSTILRAFPTNAATFAVVSWTFRLFGKETNVRERTSMAEVKPGVVTSHVPRVTDEQEPFLTKWNTFLKSVSKEKYPWRLYLSRVSTMSYGGSMDSVDRRVRGCGIPMECESCDAGSNGKRNVRFRNVVVEKEKEKEEEEEEEEYVEEDGKEKVEWPCDGQTSLECSCSPARVINAVDLAHTRKMFLNGEKNILHVEA